MSCRPGTSRRFFLRGQQCGVGLREVAAAVFGHAEGHLKGDQIGMVRPHFHRPAGQNERSCVLLIAGRTLVGQP